MTHYERFLNNLVDEVFERAVEMDLSWIDLADRAGVSATTVYNLGNRVTRFPLLRTFFLLARAVRMNVRLIKKELSAREETSQTRQAVRS